MPAKVNHDERRAEITEIAAQLVADGGADAATIRAIASAGGFSTKVVSHYFSDKRALMLLTYKHSARLAVAATTASQAAHPDDVQAFCNALLPTDEVMQRSWRVWLTFWGLAVADPELSREQQARVQNTRDRLYDILLKDPAFRGQSDAERRDCARALLTSVLGIAVQAVFDPAGWPAERQYAVLGITADALKPAP